MDHVVIFLDFDGRVVKWNDDARSLFGYAKDEIVGKHVSHFFNDEDCISRLAERELREAMRSGWSDDESWLVRSDGSQFRATGVTLAIMDGAGDLYGFAKIVSDLTSTFAAEAAVRETR